MKRLFGMTLSNPDRGNYLINSLYNGLITGMKSILIGILTFSCNQFIDVELDKSQTSSDLVFSNDVTATSAVAGIYHDMYNDVFAGGYYHGTAALTGLSADELITYQMSNGIAEFQQNNLSPDNDYVFGLWRSIYKNIYNANSALEGLENSNTISSNVSRQLIGEVCFVRAFSYFYLTNLFGDVPLVTTTNYQKNAILPRTNRLKIYEHIISDLALAQINLTEEYISTERVRPNRATATALLARVHLFQENWAESEQEATSIINDPEYSLISNLDEVFLRNSMETIWQLTPVNGVHNTNEGLYFVITNNPPQYHALSDGLLNSFEPGDKRLHHWVGNYSEGTDVFYFPYKYKSHLSNAAVTEYSMVLRLAEQYLIRAEARAQQGNLLGAVADINSIRFRAGLPQLQEINPNMQKEELLDAIKKERRIELFAEWGHRWLDLKRTHQSLITLTPLKTNYTIDDELYPIPLMELERNPFLSPQNAGY